MRARPMEFPGRLKQLKELDNSGVFNPIDNNPDHFRVKRGDRTLLEGSPEALFGSSFSSMVLIRTGVLEHEDNDE